MKALLLVALFAVAAQVLPSCGNGGREVIGWVDEKYVDRSEPGRRYFIVINRVEYDVTFGFWNSVDIGDLVKWDGIQWTIVRKGTRLPQHAPISFFRLGQSAA